MDEDLLRRIAASTDADDVLTEILKHFRADTATLHRLAADGLLHLEAHAGAIPADLLSVIRTIPVGKGIAGLAVERKAPVDLCNLQMDSSGDVRPRAKETGVKGSVCVPLMEGDRAVGALGVATHAERAFSADEIETLLAAGRILAQPR